MKRKTENEFEIVDDILESENLRKFTIQLERCDSLIEKLKKEKRFRDTSKRSKGTHKCQHCSQTFTFTSLLDEHIRGVHLGEYKCKYCKRAFSNKSKLQKHLSEANTCIVKSGKVPSECIVDNFDKIDRTDWSQQKVSLNLK